MKRSAQAPWSRRPDGGVSHDPMADVTSQPTCFWERLRFRLLSHITTILCSSFPSCQIPWIFTSLAARHRIESSERPYVSDFPLNPPSPDRIVGSAIRFGFSIKFCVLGAAGFVPSMAACLQTQRNLSREFRFSDSEQILKYLEACCNSPAERAKPFEDGIFLENMDDLWAEVRAEARRNGESEPLLASFLYSTILAQRSLERAVAFHLSNKLCNSTFPSALLYNLLEGVITESVETREAIRADMRAVKQRDPSCVSYVHCLLNFKGFLACQAHRVAHRLWNKGRVALALAIQSRVSEVFAVDVHPGARIGKGLLFDHATGLVVGETAVIGDDVSILHNVTLGGTGKQGGDRHPKIGDGVLIGAGANVLGNIKIGDGAKIGAGSVVLTDVPPYTTAVGNPAKLVGGKRNPSKHQKPASLTMDHASYITEWSDYVI